MIVNITGVFSIQSALAVVLLLLRLLAENIGRDRRLRANIMIRAAKGGQAQCKRLREIGHSSACTRIEQ